MAASFTIAARNNGFTKSDRRRRRSASVAGLPRGDGRVRGDAHHGHLVRASVRTGPACDAIATMARARKARRRRKRTKRARRPRRRRGEKARTRDSLQALSKLAEHVDGQYRIVSQPPIVIPVRELESASACPPTSSQRALHEQFRAYRATLQDDRRQLLERFEVIDVARKVVGVGSVGTRAFIVLLQGRDQQDPLFLQVKEATASVLEDHLPKSRYKQPGERVVQGQRMMQAASDIYLGWTKGVEANRYLYWRQLRDMKGSIDVEAMTPTALEFYARIAGRRLRARTRAPAIRSRSPRTSARTTVRPVDHRLLRALRRPERPRFPSVRRRGEVRAVGSDRGRLNQARTALR